MENQETAQGFAIRAKQFFGLKPDQKMSEFVGELKALTPEDRAEIAACLNAIGLTVRADG